jgi:hypothetical protein
MTTPRHASALLFLRQLILALASLSVSALTIEAAPVVGNLTASQRTGTKLVDITYDLAAHRFGAVAVTLEASRDGGAAWTVPVASVTGADRDDGADGKLECERLPFANEGGIGKGGAGRSEWEAVPVGDGHDQSCTGELPWEQLVCLRPKSDQRLARELQKC